MASLAEPKLVGQAGYRAFGVDPAREYFYYLPSNVERETPVLVSVHGVSLNAAEHMARLRDIAEVCGVALIAPRFGREDYRGYQRLGHGKYGQRADLALLDMIDDFSHRHGIAAHRIFLSGFSGGGQFAHRFAMVHADRVASCVICSAGWYTFPDTALKFPLGMRVRDAHSEICLHPDFHKVPIHVLVGGRDNRPDPNLNMARRIVALQGTNRKARAKTWVKAMRDSRGGRDDGPVSLTILRGLGHSFTVAMDRYRLGAMVFEKLGLAGEALAMQINSTEHHQMGAGLECTKTGAGSGNRTRAFSLGS